VGRGFDLWGVGCYNGALRPPVFFCGGGAARVGAGRESYDDLLAGEVGVY
jgi:hypothetical protein